MQHLYHCSIKNCYVVNISTCCLVFVCNHSQMVQAFPGDQDVHGDPSCLYLPSLQQLPSHHGVQKVPTSNTHT